MARSENLKGTRRSTMIRRGEGFGSGCFLWMRRLGITCLCLIVILMAGLGFILSEGDNYFQQKIEKKFMTVTAKMGYRIDNILVEGRSYTDAETVRKLVGVEKGDPIFSVDPDHIKRSLDNVSWVKMAHVERRLPDTVYVRLEERQPFALWQKDKDLVLIDREGVVLTDKDLNKYKDLMMVRGEAAPEHTLELVRMLEAEPELKSRLDHANRIENRRWDLILKDGKIIKLPEKDIGLAMRNLVVQNQKEGVLDKALASIDLRDPQRLIVRAEIGKAQDYSAGLAPQAQSL